MRAVMKKVNFFIAVLFLINRVYNLLNQGYLISLIINFNIQLFLSKCKESVKILHI